MKLSTKTRYTVRALLDLAINDKGRPTQIKDIARRQELSVRYLENLFSALRANGILTSTKGKGGGFSLGKKPEDINVLGVVEAVEGKLKLSGCIDSDIYCNRSADCITRDIWAKANLKLKDYFESVTLLDMMDDYKKKVRVEKQDMYYI